jgi:hypothetical protein
LISFTVLVRPSSSGSDEDGSVRGKAVTIILPAPTGTRSSALQLAAYSTASRLELDVFDSK